MNELVLQTLKELGFNETECKVYVALLQMGRTTSSVLAQRTKMNRSTVRYTLEKFHQRGLTLMMRQNNTTHFWVESPVKLFQLVESEKKLLEKKKRQLEKAMPCFTKLLTPHKVFPRVSFFEGIEGVKRVLDDSLTSKTDILTYSDLEGYVKYLKRYNETHYSPKRRENGIFVRSFVPRTKVAEKFLKHYKSPELTENIFIDADKFPFQSEINIYDNKVSMVTFSDVRHVGLIIENEEIYETQKSMFEFSWHLAKAHISE